MASTDGTYLFNDLRSLISLVDELRDVGLQQYIKLPRIAVVGSQSSGKSSVLESIVGYDFLPRGDGVVTRRPTELRLVHLPEGDKEQAWAVFENNKDRKITDFSQVTREINELTDKVAGKNKGIIDDPIVISVYSTNCPDLTLIDLPGITRIPLSGSDQPPDIEKLTRRMAARYISDPRTIILAVIPANADMTTSDALQMAREFDPEGNRTIGVITKIDIMDKGTNAKRMLLGQDVPLKLGYVGVKNRNQQDIHDNKRVRYALKEEEDYFESHPVYSTLPPGSVGTKNLTKKLTQILYKHIKSFLPEILRELLVKLREAEERLKDLGEPVPGDVKDKVHMLWSLVTDFGEIFKNTIRGKYDRRLNLSGSKELQGGARIRQIFNNLLQEYEKATTDYSDHDIEYAIRQHEGDTLPGFPSADVFEFLIRPQLEKLREPVEECVSEVHHYLEVLSHKIVAKIFFRFPQVTGEISDLVSSVLARERDRAKEVVDALIDSEEGYIFTNDSEYISSRTNLIPGVDKPEQDERSLLDKAIAPIRNRNQSQDLFVREMRNRLDAYFKICVRNVRDTVPKSVGHFLVRSVMEKLQLELYNAINKAAENWSKLMAEPAAVAEEREKLIAIISTLKKAHRVLKKDPNLAAIADDLREEVNRRPASGSAAAPPGDRPRDPRDPRDSRERPRDPQMQPRRDPSAGNLRPDRGPDGRSVPPPPPGTGPSPGHQRAPSSSNAPKPQASLFGEANGKGAAGPKPTTANPLFDA
eukprot:GILJ01003167.1.p1 GENE.GILJ01003167.1~~GILJ01003167.1.p1  ORF type:complete len:757 (-),score=123.34 GILJ01003167.1:152-2422(-)